MGVNVTDLRLALTPAFHHLRVSQLFGEVRHLLIIRLLRLLTAIALICLGFCCNWMLLLF